MAKRGKERGEPIESVVESAPLEPIRIVERVLTRPDGTTLKVDVPVYPPFRLPERPLPSERKPAADGPTASKPPQARRAHRVAAHRAAGEGGAAKKKAG